MKKWISFVSQTGGEILDLAHIFNEEYVVYIATNHPEKLKQEVISFFKDRIITLPVKPEIIDYYDLHLEQYDLITLNGYLRLVPAEITKRYVIYNGHPGLISEFPELKGKDPQKRAFEGKYKRIGSVIHRVTELVDDGEVLTQSAINITNPKTTLDDYFVFLRGTSLTAWIQFIKKL